MRVSRCLNKLQPSPSATWVLRTPQNASTAPDSIQGRHALPSQSETRLASGGQMATDVVGFRRELYMYTSKARRAADLSVYHKGAVHAHSTLWVLLALSDFGMH